MKKTFSILYSILFFGCNLKLDTATLKKEVEETEKAFNNYASSKSIAEAFYEFAAEDAVIKRENDTIIKGKEAIKNYYSNPKYSKATVNWKPDFTDVTEDGTMAYTYGKYVWTTIDSIGNKKEFKGVFHTVWRKQKDGRWKYVWD